MPFLEIDLPPTDQRPDDTPIIWAPNHRSIFDTSLGLIGLYRMGDTAGLFVTERYFENPVVAALLDRIGAIRVDGSSGGARALITQGIDRLGRATTC